MSERDGSKEPERKSKFREARNVYRDTRDERIRDLYGYNMNTKGRHLLDLSRPELYARRAEVQSVARVLISSNDPIRFIRGAFLYEKLGKAKKILPLAIKVYKISAELEWSDTFSEQLREFIERNTGERKQQEGGLENHVTVFIVFTLAGLALSLTSLTLTGHAISGLTATTPGLLGILLFIVGLTGMFFRLRKN